MKEQQSRTKKLVYSALFAALCCVATMSVHIPTPGTGGYIHPGDALVIISGIALGPVWGGLAAGIGSALADLIGGYIMYVPITFIVKFVIALVCGFVFRLLIRTSMKVIPVTIVCGLIATVLVAGGYLFFESFMYGKGAIASVPANIIQGVAGTIFSVILVPIITMIPDFKPTGR